MPDFLFPTQTFFTDSTALGISATVTVFSAASNARGAWIVSIVERAIYAANALGVSGYWARSAAPGAFGDTHQFAAPTSIVYTNALDIPITWINLFDPRFIPAGLGVFAANFVNAQTSGLRHMAYALL
jgi:hypothetical protein